MRTALLHLRPVPQTAIHAIEAQKPFAMLQTFPSLAPEEIDVIFVTQGTVVLRRQQSALRIKRNARRSHG